MDRLQVPSDTALQAQARALGERLQARGWMLVTAESCTGGWIAKALTDCAGSSAWFEGGAVTYSNALKQALLGVTAATLDAHGAVSRECALEMVGGALARLHGDVAVAVTGIAGPSGGSTGKPAGTVWVAWAAAGGAGPHAECFHFAGDRDAVRRQTVAAALTGVRKILTA